MALEVIIMANPQEPASCRFVGTKKGCRHGSRCRFLHPAAGRLPPPAEAHHRQRQQQPQQMSRSTVLASPVTGDTIPGFYFDAVKQKYFRIVSGGVVPAATAVSESAHGTLCLPAPDACTVPGLLPRLQLQAQAGKRLWQRRAATAACAVLAARVSWPGTRLTRVDSDHQYDVQVHDSGRFVATTSTSYSGAAIFTFPPRADTASRWNLVLRAVIGMESINGGMRWGATRAGKSNLLCATYAGQYLQVLSCDPEFSRPLRTMATFRSLQQDHYWNCAWSPDTSLVAAGTCSGLQAYDWARRTQVYRLRSPHRSAVLSTVFDSENRNCLYFGTRDGCVRLVDLRRPDSAVLALPRRTLSICCLRVLHNSSRDLLCGTMSGELAMWDVRAAGQCVRRFQGHEGSHKLIDVTVNEQLGVMGEYKGDFAVLPILLLRKLTPGCFCGSVSGALGADHVFRLWDLHASTPVRAFYDPAREITAAALYPAVSAVQILYIANKDLYVMC